MYIHMVATLSGGNHQGAYLEPCPAGYTQTRLHIKLSEETLMSSGPMLWRQTTGAYNPSYRPVADNYSQTKIHISCY